MSIKFDHEWKLGDPKDNAKVRGRQGVYKPPVRNPRQPSEEK
jgi:hypothetical protein